MALRKLPTLVSEKPSPALIFSAFVPVPVRVSSVTVILRGALEHVLGQSVKARSGSGANIRRLNGQHCSGHDERVEVLMFDTIVRRCRGTGLECTGTCVTLWT